MLLYYTNPAKAFENRNHGVTSQGKKNLRKMGITGSGKMDLLLPVVNQAISGASTVKSSAPQGTTLGSLVFLTLISDINANINHSFMSYFKIATEQVEKCQKHNIR